MKELEIDQLSKKIVQDRDAYNDLCEYLRSRTKVIHKALEQQTDSVEIFRAQGQMRLIQELLNLRATVESLEEYRRG